MAANQKDIISSIIRDLLELNIALRTEWGKQQRKAGGEDQIERLKAQRDELLVQLEEADIDEFKEALESLDIKVLNNFNVFLANVMKKERPSCAPLQKAASKMIHSRQKKIAAEKPKISPEKKPAKVKEVMITAEVVVINFLKNHGIVHISLGEDKTVVDPENEHSITSAAKAIVQYFGFQDMKAARKSNLLFNILDPESKKKDEELIILLLSAGKEKSDAPKLSFPYLICFAPPQKKHKFVLKGSFDKAMLYRFYHVLFHAIIYSITADYKININVGAIAVLRDILSSLDKTLALEFSTEKIKAIKEKIFGSSEEKFSPDIVYQCALEGKAIGDYFIEEGMRLEAKETLIDVKALAKHVVAFMNSQEDAIIIMGVPEEKKGHKDGELKPNLASGFSYGECEAKIAELKAYITENIGIVNSTGSFHFEDVVSFIIVPLKDIRSEDDSSELEGKYCLLLKIKSQNYLSYLRLTPDSDGQAIAVYVRDYCNSTIESGQIEDSKILTYFLYKEFLAKERQSSDIKVLYKAHRLFGYFGNSHKECANDQDKKRIISIYYLAKIYQKMSDGQENSHLYMLYRQLLQLMEEFALLGRPEDRINKLITQLYSGIIECSVLNQDILVELKQALREEGYIPEKSKTSIASDDVGMQSQLSGSAAPISIAL